MSGPEALSEKIIEHEHTADVMYEVVGESLSELFELAALGMFRYMVDISRVEPRECREVSAEGFDLESLMYKWLENLLVEHELTGHVFSRVHVREIVFSREEGGERLYLRARVCGEKIDRDRHEPGVVVKAVTYSQMFIHRDDKGLWRTYIVLDI